MVNLDNMTRRFVLGETKNAPSIMAYVQALNEIVENFKVTTIKETRKLEIAKQHIREIKRHAKKILEENKDLNERLAILEEKKDK